jgi:hypothetical protein
LSSPNTRLLVVVAALLATDHGTSRGGDAPYVVDTTTLDSIKPIEGALAPWPNGGDPHLSKRDYDQINYVNFLVDANDGKPGRFVYEMSVALDDLVKSLDPSVGNARTQFGITYVTAPAGFGKSELLTHLIDLLDPKEPEWAKTFHSYKWRTFGKTNLEGYGLRFETPAEVWKRRKLIVVSGLCPLRFCIYDRDGEAVDRDECKLVGKECQIEKLKKLLDGPWRSRKLNKSDENAAVRAFEGVVGRTPLKDYVIILKLDKLESVYSVRSTMLDDLRNNNSLSVPAFGKLRAFDYDQHDSPGLWPLIEAFRQTPKEGMERVILIIDGIDEIHPESARSLLGRLEYHVNVRQKQDKNGFLRVFVIGRPEGFADYHKVPREPPGKRLPIRLEPPDFRTTGDLETAVKSVVRYHNGLVAEPQGEAKKRLDCQVRATLENLEKNDFLRECAFNLAVLGELAKLSAVELNFFKPWGLSAAEKDRLEAMIFEFLLDRNRETHHRPLLMVREYERLFEDIAAKYSGEVDTSGYFYVMPSDTVSVDVDVFVEGKIQRHEATYRVVDVLNRSGVTVLDPVSLHVPRYRFYPSWLHRHLAERYQKRMRGRGPGS